MVLVISAKMILRRIAPWEDNSEKIGGSLVTQTPITDIEINHGQDMVNSRVAIAGEKIRWLNVHRPAEGKEEKNSPRQNESHHRVIQWRR